MKPCLPVDLTYERILCAVGVGPGPREAVHQALGHCGPESSLHFVAARRDGGRDASLPRDLTEMQARGALEIALCSARRAGIEAAASLLRGRPVEEQLIEASARADLLVLAAGTWLGRQATTIDPTALRIATDARCPVLLVGREPFPAPPRFTCEPSVPTPRRPSVDMALVTA